MARVVCLEKLVGLILKVTLPWVACVSVAREGGPWSEGLVGDSVALPASKITEKPIKSNFFLKESPLGPRIGQCSRDVSARNWNTRPCIDPDP